MKKQIREFFYMLRMLLPVGTAISPSEPMTVMWSYFRCMQQLDWDKASKNYGLDLASGVTSGTNQRLLHTSYLSQSYMMLFETSKSSIHRCLNRKQALSMLLFVNFQVYCSSSGFGPHWCTQSPGPASFPRFLRLWYHCLLLPQGKEASLGDLELFSCHHTSSHGYVRSQSYLEDDLALPQSHPCIHQPPLWYPRRWS